MELLSDIVYLIDAIENENIEKVKTIL